MAEEYINEVWRQLDSGAFAQGDVMAAILYAGIKMHLEALDQLAANIALLKVQVMKIEKKMNNEEK